MYHQDVLAQTQREIEQGDLQKGAENYLQAQAAKAEREGFERRDDVQKTIRGAIPILATALTRWIAEAKAKKGRPNAAVAPLAELDPDQVAYAALSRTFHTVAKGEELSTTAIAIGRAVQTEVEAQMIEAKDHKAAKRFLAMAEGEASQRTTSRRHEQLVDRLGVGLEWSRRTQALTGGAVLNVLLTALPGIFERGTIIDHRGTVPVVKLGQDAIDHLGELAESVAWLRPILRPMIVQPRPWERYDTGAYLEFAVSKTVPLIRTFNRDHQKMVREAIKDGSMAECLEGLNAIQETRFAIDRRVYDVMRWVRGDNRQPGESFPKADPVAAPVKVPAAEWELLAPEARSALSRKRRSANNLRSAAAVNCSVFGSDIAEAERLLEVEAFFLPHSLDFRGRVYAVPHFNPQRSDHIKALFRFADTVALGEDGGQWLAIHLANCGDFGKVSKQSFQARLDWVWANEEAILGAAEDPAGTYDWWATADSPFCFLQACFEWAEWAGSGYSDDFESCISVALDGSCSGLQHYSAMTRSADEGYHVNLLPRDKPGDIYQVVADQGRPLLEALATRGDQKGAAAGIVLAQGFDRSKVKRNVMTYFYGSAAFGMRDQHMADLMRPLADKVALGELEAHPYAMLTERTDKDTGEVTEQLDGGFTCAQLLANSVYAAVVSVAPKADEAAKWFQTVAAVLAHESQPVVWRTPVGLPVVQRYSEYTTKQVNMWLYDRKVHVPTGQDKTDEEGNVLTRIRCLIREAPTKRIDKKKARSAISPNVVHSLDAAHLIRTVVFAKGEGIAAFQLIHDSFATHAGNTSRFFLTIRRSFVDLYETYDPFEELERYARSVLSDEGQEKLPPLPVRGTLELGQVVQSDYAFA